MSTRVPEILYDGAACRLAFRAGQAWARLLEHKAAEMAKCRCGDEVVVTVEDIAACMRQNAPEEVCAAVGITSDGQIAGRLSA
jgi:hypothetical protein